MLVKSGHINVLLNSYGKTYVWIRHERGQEVGIVDTSWFSSNAEAWRLLASIWEGLCGWQLETVQSQLTITLIDLFGRFLFIHVSVWEDIFILKIYNFKTWFFFFPSPLIFRFYSEMPEAFLIYFLLFYLRIPGLSVVFSQPSFLQLAVWFKIWLYVCFF